MSDHTKHAEFEALRKVLPPDVYWGDALTPAILQHVVAVLSQPGPHDPMADLSWGEMMVIRRAYKQFLKDTNLPGDARISESFIKASQYLLAGNAQAPGFTDAARAVLAERERQVAEEGWTARHDDIHRASEMALAAACYATSGGGYAKGLTPPMWPWSLKWWKPSYGRRDLVKAGALILAEIERLDRASPKASRQSNAPALADGSSRSVSALTETEIADIAGGCMDTARYNMFMSLIRQALRERP
jgi:hypothetical protein